MKKNARSSAVCRAAEAVDRPRLVNPKTQAHARRKHNREDTNMSEMWILVADSARARVFTVDKDKRDLKEIEEFQHPESQAQERELITDRPGRAFDSHGPGRHAMGQSVSPKEHEAQKFCKKVAEEIEAARVQERFNRLVLVSDPSFLGELRKMMSSSTSRMVTGELVKNLVHLKPREIMQHLKEAEGLIQ
jgi:protein required for attachment to host cells